MDQESQHKLHARYAGALVLGLCVQFGLDPLYFEGDRARAYWPVRFAVVAVLAALQLGERFVGRPRRGATTSPSLFLISAAINAAYARSLAIAGADDLQVVQTGALIIAFFSNYVVYRFAVVQPAVALSGIGLYVFAAYATPPGHLRGSLVNVAMAHLGCLFAMYLLRHQFNAYVKARSEREVARQRSLELENELLSRDLEAAAAVQEAIVLPKVKSAALDLATHYRAARHAGGDWFAVHVDEPRNALFVFMMDVTGHGVASALLTGLVSGGARAILAAAAPEDGVPKTLAAVFRMANSLVFEVGGATGRCATMCGIGIDLATGEGQYINAGHPFPCVITGAPARVKHFARSCNLLGFDADRAFASAPFAVAAGESLFLYTDGLIENEGPGRARLDKKRLHRALLTGATPAAIKDAVLAAADGVWKGAAPADDCSFIVVRFNQLQPQHEGALPWQKPG